MTRCLLLGPGGRAQGRCRGKLHCCCFLALSSSLVARASAAPGDPAPLSDSLTRGFPGGGSSHGLRLALPAGAALTPRGRGAGCGSRQLQSVCPNHTSGPGAGIPGRGQGRLHPLCRRTCARTGPPQAPLWPMGLLEFVSTQNQRPEAPEVRCSLFPGCGYSAERLKVALGRAGRKTHSQLSGSFLMGTPPHSRGCAM